MKVRIKKEDLKCWYRKDEEYDVAWYGNSDKKFEVVCGVHIGKVINKIDCDIIDVEQPSLGKPDTHYDNTNGSLYKFAVDHDLNAYEFDLIKRIVRCRKKGQFREDLEKTKRVIDLYLKEFKE